LTGLSQVASQPDVWAGSSAQPPARRLLALLTLAAAVWSAVYARTTLGPLQEAIRVALTLSDNQMALLQGPALSLPLVVAAIPLGLFINRFSRTRLILLFALSNLIATAGAALAPSFVVLLASRCIIGVTGTATFVTANSVLADLFASAERGRATLLLAVGGVCGMSAAFALGGAVLAVSGSGPNAWRWAMLGLSVPLVPILLLLLPMRDPPRTDVRVERPTAREACVGLWRFRAVLGPLTAASVTVAGIADGAATVWVWPTLARRFALSPGRVGVIIALSLLVSGVLGPILGGTMSDLCQRRGGGRATMTAMVGLAIVSVPAALFAIAPGVVSVGTLFVIFMMVGAAFNVMAPVLAVGILPNELRGICLSLISAACLLAAFGVGPIVVSWISSVMGGPGSIGPALAVVCCTSCLVGVVALERGRRFFCRA
jgi:MFS family permease